MKTSEKIIDYLNKHQHVSGSSLVDYLGITDRAVRKQLKVLLDSNQITKVGKPPRVYYSILSLVPKQAIEQDNLSNIDKSIIELIQAQFLYVSARGTVHKGWVGFKYWCNERQFDLAKTAGHYKETYEMYRSYKKDGLISGMYKMKATYDDVALNEVFYVDFYSIDMFGKTKLGQLLLFAKQSQNREMINEIADIVKPSILKVINRYRIDGVGYIPPTVKRELQLIRQLQKRLNLNVRVVSIKKIITPVAVPQKTLSKLEDRIINARETISLDDNGTYNNILLIDDALGSGATLNEVAKKIRQKEICKGKIIGLVITGSFRGFEVISEV